MISLNKKIHIKTLKDLSDFLYVFSMATIFILALIYVTFIVTEVKFLYSPILTGNPVIHCIVAMIVGITFYISMKTQVLKNQVIVALFYTMLMPYVLFLLPHQINVDFNPNMYSLSPSYFLLPSGFMVLVSIILLWVHVFYRNTYNLKTFDKAQQ